MSTVYMILAIGPDGVIGKGKELAWHSKVDFYHFVTQTKGCACIFGDVTFYNLPKYPLKNRLNIVVNIQNTDTFVLTNEDRGSWIETNSIEKALDYAKNYDRVFICGGKSVYKYCLDHNLINAIYLTKISSEKLSKDIQEHPDDYVRFPYTEEEFLKGFTYTGNLENEYKDQHIIESIDSDLKCEIKEYRKYEVNTPKTSET